MESRFISLPENGAELNIGMQAKENREISVEIGSRIHSCFQLFVVVVFFEQL